MEQALIVVIKLSDNDWGNEKDEELIYPLEKQLMESINNSGFGHYDGHEFGGGYCSIFISGEDADQLYKLVASIIRKYSIPRKSFIVKQLGEAREERISLPFAIS